MFTCYDRECVANVTGFLNAVKLGAERTKSQWLLSVTLNHVASCRVESDNRNCIDLAATILPMHAVTSLLAASTALDSAVLEHKSLLEHGRVGSLAAALVAEANAAIDIVTKLETAMMTLTIDIIRNSLLVYDCGRHSIMKCPVSVSQRLGYDEGEVEGTRLRSHVHPEDAALLFDRAPMPTSVRLRLKCKDGSYVWFDSTAAYASQPPHVSLLTACLHCVETEVKLEMEKATLERFVAAEEINRRHANVLSHVGMGLVITGGEDTGFAIEYVNPKWEELTGYSAEDVVGSSGRILRGPGTDTDTLTDLREALTRRASFGCTIKNYRKNGSPFWNSMTCFPTSDGRFVGTIREVSGEKDARDRLEVALKANATAVARVECERAMNEFIAHEVRNPLSVAIAAIGFVRANSEFNQDLTRDLDAVDASLAFIVDLLSNMLDVSRFAFGEVRLHNAPCDLVGSVIAPVIDMLSTRANGVKLRMLVDNAPMWVMGDTLRLKQIISNLVCNAIKHVHDTVAVPWIGVGVLQTESGVVVWVCDTGPGIPIEKRGDLFKKFVQLNTHVQGTGIGLALTKIIVEAMGGTIALDEAYTAGAKFDVTLPLEVAAAAPPRPAPRTLPPVNKVPRKVLVVDDDVAVRGMFARMLKSVKPDWTVDVCDSGEACLEMDWRSFDIITMDQHMPTSGGVMTGTQTVHELRTQGCFAHIIGVSGNDESAAFTEAGADDFWQKPFPSANKLALKLSSFKPGRATDPSVRPTTNKYSGLKTLELGLGADFIPLWTVFKKDVSNDLRLMRGHISAESWKEAQARSHKIKGVLLCYSLSETAAFVGSIDVDLKAAAAAPPKHDLESRAERLQCMVDDAIAFGFSLQPNVIPLM